MSTRGDGLDALLEILANLARPQAPQMVPSDEETRRGVHESGTGSPKLERRLSEKHPARSIEPWYSAIDSDEHFQSLWERSQEWNED